MSDVVSRRLKQVLKNQAYNARRFVSDAVVSENRAFNASAVDSAIAEIERLKKEYTAMKEAGQGTIAKLIEERDRLREALEYCAAESWEGYDIDGGAFQDMMVKAGLMVEVPACDAFAAEYGVGTMFVLVWKKEATDE